MAIRVLFLCTGNSARSVIAEALLRATGGAGFEVHSAGTHPKGLNPYTRRVLGEEGIDVSSFESKSVGRFLGQAFDYVITVCDSAAEECPVLPGQGERLHWSLTDPAALEGSEAQKLVAFRDTVEQVRSRLAEFIPSARRAVVETGTTPDGGAG